MPRAPDRATGRAGGRRRSWAAARRTSEAARRAVLLARLTRAACARLRGAAGWAPGAAFALVRRRAVLRCAGGLDLVLLFALFLAADFTPARLPLVFLVFFTFCLRQSFLSSLEPGVEGPDGENEGRGAAGCGGV